MLREELTCPFFMEFRLGQKLSPLEAGPPASRSDLSLNSNNSFYSHGVTDSTKVQHNTGELAGSNKCECKVRRTFQSTITLHNTHVYPMTKKSEEYNFKFQFPR